MKNFKFNTKDNTIHILLIAFATLTPFLVPLLLVTISGNNIFHIAPYYVGGDAVARYDYIRNILENGQILGYNGYDFVLAKIPSLGSAWGFFWTFPYLIFGKLFGWDLNAPIIANILFLCLANLIFILLTKANKNTTIGVIVISALLFINIDYSISSMSEPSRYAITIVLVGMMYRLAYFETGYIFKYFAVPATIIFGAATFILLSAFIIPYCLLIIKCKNNFVKGGITLLIFGISTILIKKSNSLFCTPYYEVFNMKKDIIAFKEHGLLMGIIVTIRNSLHNLLRFSYGAFTNINYQHGKFTWFVLICWILIFALAYTYIFKKYRSDKDKYIVLGALYLLLIITMGYIVLYNDVIATLIRGINTALCGAVFLLTLMDSRKILMLYVVLALIWSPFFVSNFMSMCNEDYRCLTQQQEREIQIKRDIAAKYIKLDKNADPWENTVAIRYGGKSTAFAIPSGAGKISMHNVTINEHARYVLIGTDGSAKDIQNPVNDHLSANHSLITQNNYFTILKRND